MAPICLFSFKKYWIKIIARANAFRFTLTHNDQNRSGYSRIDMLVITRKPGEAIWIENDIRIIVLRASKRGIRLGIEAPGKVVRREETLGKDNHGEEPES